MKISYYGFQTLKLEFAKVSILTDPVSMFEAGLKTNSLEGDILLYSDPKFLTSESVIDGYKDLQIKTQFKDKHFEISKPGEFEIGEVMIRRNIGSDYYVIDEGYARVVYVGFVGQNFNLGEMKDLGDVDVLILPVGDAGYFPESDKLEKIISSVDPKYLIPSGYNAGSLKGDFAKIRSLEEFLKAEGFTAVREEKTFKVEKTATEEGKAMEVVVLKS